jgi:hypothetical protein
MVKKLRILLPAALAAATLGLVTVPTAAQAAPTCAYGNFCVTADGSGFYSTPGNSNRWPASVFNKADQVQNNGNPYVGARRVDIFYDPVSRTYDPQEKTYHRTGGAYACIDTGTTWNLRTGRYSFSWIGYHGKNGHFKDVHDDATAHHWVSTGCGDYNDIAF